MDKKINIVVHSVQQLNDGWHREAVAADQAARIEEHRRGLHTYGSMRRDCPLCVVGR